MTNQQTPSPYSCSSSIDRRQSDSSSQDETSGNNRFPSSAPWLPITVQRMGGQTQREGGNIGRYSPPPLPRLQVVDPTSYFSPQQRQIRTGSGCSTRDLQVIIDEVLSIVEDDNDDFLQ